MNTRQMQQLLLRDFDIHEEEDIHFKIATEVNQEVRVLESSVVDLHELTADLARIVEDQGEMVDHIEANMNQAVQHTEDGTKRLERIEIRQRTCVIM